MNDDIMKELWDIRNFLERKYHSYPVSCCGDAIDLVARVTGISIKAGHFDTRYNSGRCSFLERIYDLRLHGWNYDDGDESIVDLSADQFHFTNEKVLVIPKDSLMAARYRPSFIILLSFYRFRRKKPYFAEAYEEFQSGSAVQAVFDGPRTPVAEL